MKLFLNRNNKYDAKAEYDDKTGSFTVLKGSLVSDSISNAPTFRGTKKIQKTRELYVQNRIVIKNVVFRSSSTAGNFVTGYSTAGPSSWKDKNGKTLKELQNKLLR